MMRHPALGGQWQVELHCLAGAPDLAAYRVCGGLFVWSGER